MPIAQLAAAPFRQAIEASEVERQGLSRRFDLVALDRLEAEVELIRQAGDQVLLRAEFSADFVQSCVVSLEPVPGSVSGRFSLRYGPPEADDPAALGWGGSDSADQDEAFEPLTGSMIDIGEAVAQEFSLALPEFPRHPDAEVDAIPREESPFAVLAGVSRHAKASPDGS